MKKTSQSTHRRGLVMVFTAVILVLIFAFVAFSVDVGYMTIVKSELQNAADASALAGVRELAFGNTAVKTAAKDLGLLNNAAGAPVTIADADIEPGHFDYVTKEFTPGTSTTNALKVTARVLDQPLFFAPIINNDDFSSSASSIAMLNPRDIVFVVDLSGSMNDDTEPCWATDTINAKFAPDGYPNVATPLMQNLYDDLSFGTFPGLYQYVGQPLAGVPQDHYAYAEMTKDDGPLTDPSLAATYRIDNADDEPTRKQKAYSWIIDNQIAVLMPNALPAPNSSTSYAYWEKYLDYILQGAYVGTPPPPDPDDGGGGGGGGGGPVDPPPPTPPLGHQGDNRFEQFANQSNRLLGQVAGVSSHAGLDLLLSGTAISVSPGPGMPRRGTDEYDWLPWADEDRFYNFNNPNYFTFPSTSFSAWAWRNQIGYITYTQYMMDWGRNRSPEYDNNLNANVALTGKTPLSLLNPYCPKHWEATAGGTFEFPPREQPMHAVRRAMIAAIDLIQTRNGGISPEMGDRVAIVTFDGLDSFHAPQLVLPLTADFNAAMLACTQLQAVSDIGSTTATEAGLLIARDHLKLPANGGSGRTFANRVVVLLTDGVPNAWVTSTGNINDYIVANPSGEFYASGYVWYNAALAQAAQAESNKITLFPVGMGLGTDYNFMDRMARLAGTDEGGLSVRGSGNPAEYEERLTDIFEEIVLNPGGRLVD